MRWRLSSSSQAALHSTGSPISTASPAARPPRGGGALFWQRLQVGDYVLPILLVWHEVDHLRSLDEFAGALEIFVQGLFVPGDVCRLHRRRIVITGLRPAL